MKLIKLLFLILPVLSFCHHKDKWIIVTTIQHPTPALKKLAALPDWQLLVIGDKKTPSDWYLDEKCIYLSPEDQERLPYELSKLLPWNYYSRKNLGYLYAIDHGAEVIYETDYDNYVIEHIKSFQDDDDIVTLSSEDSVINVYSYFGQPTIWPRGYPLSSITQSNNFEVISQIDHKKIVIEQGLVDNEPDVDAIFRLTRTDNSGILFSKNKPACVLSSGTLCPFNTQNTLFHKQAFWGLYIPTNVAFRVCDIWRGYLTQRLLWETDGCICFTPPMAIQERNAHDFMKDFIGEQDLYLKTNDLISFLLRWEYSSNHDILKNLHSLYCDAMNNNFIGVKEDVLIRAWINDLKMLKNKRLNIIEN